MNYNIPVLFRCIDTHKSTKYPFPARGQFYDSYPNTIGSKFIMNSYIRHDKTVFHEWCRQ